jgi:hypothetical protein
LSCEHKEIPDDHLVFDYKTKKIEARLPGVEYKFIYKGRLFRKEYPPGIRIGDLRDVTPEGPLGDYVARYVDHSGIDLDDDVRLSEVNPSQPLRVTVPDIELTVQRGSETFWWTYQICERLVSIRRQMARQLNLHIKKVHVQSLEDGIFLPGSTRVTALPETVDIVIVNETIVLNLNGEYVSYKIPDLGTVGRAKRQLNLVDMSQNGKQLDDDALLMQLPDDCEIVGSLDTHHRIDFHVSPNYKCTISRGDFRSVNTAKAALSVSYFHVPSSKISIVEEGTILPDDAIVVPGHHYSLAFSCQQTRRVTFIIDGQRYTRDVNQFESLVVSTSWLDKLGIDNRTFSCEGIALDGGRPLSYANLRENQVICVEGYPKTVKLTIMLPNHTTRDVLVPAHRTCAYIANELALSSGFHPGELKFGDGRTFFPDEQPVGMIPADTIIVAMPAQASPQIPDGGSEDALVHAQIRFASLVLDSAPRAGTFSAGRPGDPNSVVVGTPAPLSGISVQRGGRRSAESEVGARPAFGEGRSKSQVIGASAPRSRITVQRGGRHSTDSEAAARPAIAEDRSKSQVVGAPAPTSRISAESAGSGSTDSEAAPRPPIAEDRSKSQVVGAPAPTSRISAESAGSGSTDSEAAPRPPIAEDRSKSQVIGAPAPRSRISAESAGSGSTDSEVAPRPPIVGRGESTPPINSESTGQQPVVVGDDPRRVPETGDGGAGVSNLPSFRFQLPDGRIVTHQFSPRETIQKVKEWLPSVVGPGVFKITVGGWETPDDMTVTEALENESIFIVEVASAVARSK